MKNTIKWVFVLCAISLSGLPTEAQLIRKAENLIQKNGGLSEKDAADGIKEALTKGTNEGVKLVSVVNGYFGNPSIKIPFPPDAKIMETKLRAVGLGNKVDEVVLSINRAAEDAAAAAAPIFIDAIRKMSIQDAVQIVRRDQHAATSYLSNHTSAALKVAFKPTIKSSLDKVNATKYWDELVKTYNKLPFVKKMNPDLAKYVTSKAIDGLFIMVANEEEKIRKDPMARTSDLLKKVFGN